MPEIICPKCQRRLQFGAEAVGKEARCPACDAVFMTNAAGPIASEKKLPPEQNLEAVLKIVDALAPRSAEPPIRSAKPYKMDLRLPSEYTGTTKIVAGVLIGTAFLFLSAVIFFAVCMPHY